jgi:hypothetical protein
MRRSDQRQDYVVNFFQKRDVLTRCSIVYVHLGLRKRGLIQFNSDINKFKGLGLTNSNKVQTKVTGQNQNQILLLSKVSSIAH